MSGPEKISGLDARKLDRVTLGIITAVLGVLWLSECMERRQLISALTNPKVPTAEVKK